MRYRKKPIVIEAKQMFVTFEVDTLEGKMTGQPGDYLVTGMYGERYPCKKEIFESTYECVGSGLPLTQGEPPKQFSPEVFTDLSQGPITKALHDFKKK